MALDFNIKVFKELWWHGGTMLKDVRAFDIFHGMFQSLCLVCRFSTWGVQALGFVFWLASWAAGNHAFRVCV